MMVMQDPNLINGYMNMEVLEETSSLSVNSVQIETIV
jgi:hypothetical protein